MALLTSFGVALAVCLPTALGRKVVVEKMPASGALGTWTYEDPGQDEVFGQYMYTSPMGRTCIRNLTVKATMCNSCYLGFVTPAYVQSRECIPACLEGLAWLTDHLNGRPGVLKDACIQLVVSDYNDIGFPIGAMPSTHHFASDVVEAVHKGPRKHGIITDIPANYGEKIFEAAANLAVPLIRTGAGSGGGFSEDPIDPQRWTEFRTLTDSHWMLPGIVKRLLPSKFAVLTDTTTASAFLQALKAESAKQSKEVAVARVVLTETAQVTDEDAINELVDEMVKMEIRYLLVKLSWPYQARFLACALYKNNLHRSIRVFCLGHTSDSVNGYSSCAHEELVAAILDGGWTFVQDGFFSGFSSVEEYVVNRATGNPGKPLTGQSFNLAGGPWQDHFDFGELQPTPACADDDAGTNASSTFRTLLSEGLGESLGCQDVTFLGQSWNHLVVRDVAKYCPISACAYNALMAACRVSCACSLGDPAGTLEHPDGGALCRDIQHMPVDNDPRSGYRAEHWRCEGRNCRELAFAPSAIAFKEPILKLAHSLNGAGSGFCPYKYSWTPDDNSSSACMSPLSWMWWDAGNLADGLYSFAMAFQCMEKKDQLVDFIESDYNNAVMRDSLVDCLKNNVSFEGVGGRISFGYMQSPPPGHTYSALHHSSSVAGAVLQDDVALFNMVVSRDNWLACEAGTGQYAPRLNCNGTSIEFNLDQDNWDVFPLGSPAHCPVGEYPITIGEHVEGVRLDECTPCPPGTYKDIAGPSRCKVCPPGWAAASPGQSSCMLCGLGKRSAAPANATVLNLGHITQTFGASGCDHCEDGHDSDVGASDCVACPKGRYREVGVSPREPGVHCTACPVGKYLQHTGGSQCEACPACLSTQMTSSTSPSECICGAGTYKKDGSCHPCPEGMMCITGSDEANFPGADGTHNGPFPQLKYSFYTTAEEPLAPFKCMRESACPGGPPGSCSGSLTGLTCTSCPQGMFFRSGECSECGGARGLIVIPPAVIVALVCVTTMHILTNWPSASASMPLVIGGVILGLAVNFFLTFASFNALSIVWRPPLSHLFSMLSFFSFNFEGFGLFCALSNNSYIVRYVLKLLVVPVSFTMVIVGAYVCSHVPRLQKVANFNVPALMNSAGFVMSMFFISVGLTSLEGLRCIRNPNQRWTLLADTSVICFEGGEHTNIMIVSIFAIFSCPLPFLALNMWVSFCYARLALKYGVRFTAAVRFLTLRVQPAYLAFAVAWNCRSFLVSLLPVLARDQYDIQVGLLMATFICWFGMQTSFQCWRFQWVNVVDPIMSASLILLIFGFAMLATAEQSTSEAVGGWYIIAVATTLVLILIFTAVYNFAAHVTSKTRYGFFVTHHKAAAALYARQVKMMFDLPTFASPFLDVDDLDDLDKVAFAVKASCRHLVILTKSVLERPWCALEVAAAYLNGIPTTVIQPNEDVVELSPQYLEQVVSCFSSEDWSIFSQYGITRDALVSAFNHLAELPKILYPLRTSNLPLLDQCVRLTLGTEANKFKKPIFAVDPGKVVHIVYNAKDDLQCSAAYVALQLFRERQWDAMLCGPGDEAFPERLDAKRGVGVVFLSKGLPADPTAMGTLLAMQRAGIGFVTVLSQENFWKPDAAVLESLQGGRRSRAGPEAEQMQEMERLAPEASLEEMAQTLPLLYSKIALGFAPECNYRLMLAEFKIIEERANGQLRVNAAGASPTTSRSSSPRGKGRRDAAAAASPPHDDVPLSDPIETGGGGGGGSAISEDHQKHQQHHQQQLQQQQQQQPPSDPLETGGVGGSASSEDQQQQLQQQQLQQLQQRPSTLEMENDEPCVARGGAGSRQ